MKPDQLNLRASILDRLVDDDPGSPHGPVRDSLPSISHIKAAVIRDLENLLNTKRQVTPSPAVYREVNNSLFAYGLKDYTALNPGSISVKQQLRQDIEKTISRFEPRLKNVSVQVDAPDQKDRNLRFRITALLRVEPITEPVAFDTYFDISRGEYRITR